jgi:hypothetical protein
MNIPRANRSQTAGDQTQGGDNRSLSTPGRQLASHRSEEPELQQQCGETREHASQENLAMVLSNQDPGDASWITYDAQRPPTADEHNQSEQEPDSR